MRTPYCIVDDHIGVITLNHGKVNALSKTLLDHIVSALEALQSTMVRVVILRAPQGARVFSAGHDVNELPTNGRDPLTYNDPLRQVVRAIEHCPMPVIAMIEGSVWGGAYNISGALNFLKVAGLHLLKEMLFTGEPVSAPRLETFGIVNHVVTREDLESFTMRLAHTIAMNSPLVHRVLKEEIRALANAHPLIPETYERVQALRREVYDSHDYQEGIRAFLEKRAPQFRGN